MSLNSNDAELLKALRTQPVEAVVRLISNRHGGLVRAVIACATGDAGQIEKQTSAVFAALVRDARHLSRNTFLPGWLFEAACACSRRELKQACKLGFPVARVDSSDSVLHETQRPLDRIPLQGVPRLVVAMGKLPAKLRDAMLALHLLELETNSAAALLRRRPRRVDKLATAALLRVRKKLKRGRQGLSSEEFDRVLTASRIEATRPLDESEHQKIANEMAADSPRNIGGQLAGRVLRVLMWWKWKRRLVRFAWIFGIMIGSVAILGGSLAFFVPRSSVFTYLVEMGFRSNAAKIPGLNDVPKPWPDAAQASHVAPARVAAGMTATDVFQPTNIWVARLSLTESEWLALQPRRIAPNLNFNPTPGRLNLRNPNAQRGGVAGMLGFDFNWAHADMEFGGTLIRDVAIRFKGNGTFLQSLFGNKRPLKVNLGRFHPNSELAGVQEFTFNNLIEDSSRMHDALGYKLFRDLGVPAPRTAYAWLVLNAASAHTNRHLGLYALIESTDARFGADRFGDATTPLFKPSTPDLFLDLGTNWTAYEAIYDLKTTATLAQRRRLMDFTKILTHAGEVEYARRAGEFIDLDEFARFLAGNVLLSNYDGFLTTGQNYVLYLHPRTGKFGFIPWDLDHSWGEFPHVGTSITRERSSIWHPWAGVNRLLERTLKIEEFRQLYRAHLEAALHGPFRPERLFAKIDALSPVLRDCVRAESPFWLRRFDQAVSAVYDEGPRDGRPESWDRPVHQLKRFIANRAVSIRTQLDGKSGGIEFPPPFAQLR